MNKEKVITREQRLDGVIDTAKLVMKSGTPSFRLMGCFKRLLAQKKWVNKLLNEEEKNKAIYKFRNLRSKFSNEFAYNNGIS